MDALFLFLVPLLFALGAAQDSPNIREFYIAAVEIGWDYIHLDIGDATSDQRRWSKDVPQKYIKAVYREYTDSTYTDPKPRPAWAGIQGPVIHAQAGERVVVHFKNLASQSYTISPVGITYWKQSEGVGYDDSTAGQEKEDDTVPPGGYYEYVWDINPKDGPTASDPECLTYSYSSQVDTVRDTNSGLIGALLICRSSAFTADGQRRRPEFVLLFAVFDESKGWYGAVGERRSRERFKKSTSRKVYHTINGYINSTLPGLTLCRGRDNVFWHMIGVGTAPEIHTIQFQDHTLQIMSHRKFTVDMTPMTFITAEMKPTALGRFTASCQIHAHRHAGMSALFTVEDCLDPAEQRNAPHDDYSYEYNGEDMFNTLTFNPARPGARAIRGRKSKTWVHYIAAEEVTWNYAPHLDPTDSELSSEYFPATAHLSGYQYKKVVYVEYTDRTFTQKKTTTRTLFGPLLKGEGNDQFHIIFRNLASRPFNIYPNGLTKIDPLKKSSNVAENDLRTMGVPPNGTYGYIWKLTAEDGPLEEDPQCLTRLYQSTVNPERDLASGLVGMLLICKHDAIDVRGRLLGPDAEHSLMFAVFDENRSWYIRENIQKYSVDSSRVNPADPAFYNSNVIYSVNGVMFNGRQFSMCQSDVTFWHVANIGTQSDFLSIYFTGNPFQHDNLYQFVLTLFPMSGETVAMEMELTGEWEISAFDGSLKSRGMSIHYSIRPCDNGDLPLVDKEDDEDDYGLTAYFDNILHMGPRSIRPQNRTVAVQLCKKPVLDPNATQTVNNTTDNNVSNEVTIQTGVTGGRSPCEVRNVTVTSSEVDSANAVSDAGIPQDILEELERDGEWTASLVQEGLEPRGQRDGRRRRQVDGDGRDGNAEADVEDGGAGISSGGEERVNSTDTGAQALLWGERNETKEDVAGSNEILLNLNPPVDGDGRDGNAEADVEEGGAGIGSGGEERANWTDTGVLWADTAGERNETMLEVEESNEILLNLNPPVDGDGGDGNVEAGVEDGGAGIGSGGEERVKWTDTGVLWADTAGERNETMLEVEESNEILLNLNPPMDGDGGDGNVEAGVEDGGAGISSGGEERVTDTGAQVVLWGERNETKEDVAGSNEILLNLNPAVDGDGRDGNAEADVEDGGAGIGSGGEERANWTDTGAQAVLWGERNETKEEVAGSNEILLNLNPPVDGDGRDVEAGVEDGGADISSGGEERANWTDTGTQAVLWADTAGERNETMLEVEESNEILLNFDPLVKKDDTSLEPTSTQELDQHLELQNHIQPKPDPQMLEVLDVDYVNYAGDNSTTPKTAVSFEYDDYSQKENDTSDLSGTDYLDMRSIGQYTFRNYYIAAEEVTWDYGIRRPHQLIKAREMRRGMRTFLPEYKKVVFRAYRDEDFRRPVARGELQEHLGIMGPVIKAEINDLLTVTFKNKASRPYSFHLHGVYDRSQGAGFAQNQASSPPVGVPGEAVPPGEARVYNWKITRKQGPTDTEFDCKAGAYYSTVDKERDLHSGLIGPLVICKPNTVHRHQNMQTDIQEHSLLFHTFDETKSWYLEENLQKYCTPPCLANPADPWFQMSNKFAAINGYVAETLPGLLVAQHQPVRWHLLNVGGDREYHAVHFHGLPFSVHTEVEHRMGVYNLYPGVFGTIEMSPPTVGTWLVECTVGEQQLAGMRAKLLVYNPLCVLPLGMKTGRIADSQLTASDHLGNWEPRFARLGLSGVVNAWMGRNKKSWIQVDLQRPTLVHGLQTQGARASLREYYISLYAVSYSLNMETWATYRGNHTTMFNGNLDASRVKENRFFPPIVARYIRIQPQSIEKHPTLRMELLGCDLNSCSLPLGLERHQIPDSSFSASSSLSTWIHRWSPARARLHQDGSTNAWRPQNNNPHEWLEVDLLRVRRITGVVTQGAFSMLKQMMVTEFSVTYSDDGQSWNTVFEKGSQGEKIFPGNNDPDEEALNLFDPPLFGRYLRVHPRGWVNNIALRLEILGCDTQQ